ncbi:MAG: alpha-(1-_3)-arabinofuranosyltransferase family protein [Thermoleophilaceae bacterium]
MATILDKRIPRRALAPRIRLPVNGRAVPLSLAGISLLLAFIQRPAKAIFDTRVELGADPDLFLHRVGEVWSAQTDLGHVQSGQFVGYLFPMGPWFALAHALGLSTFLAQRLWFALLMALAAWGAVRVMDELYSTRRGLAHFAAGLLFATSPFVAVSLTHSSVTLLAYAALPWLIVAAMRGGREPTRWVWPAFAGLVLGAAGGGVNLAVLAWVVPGPLVLLGYQVAVRVRTAREAWGFAWRAGVCGLAASLWWIVPVSLSSSTGADFLKFTEQPEAIFANTSMSESLRLLGYWVAYFGSGFEGQVSAATPQAANYLFSFPVIAGTFAVPLIAFFGGLRWLRRWVYAPFFGLLAAGGLVVMSAGFPEGTPANRSLIWLYYHAASLQFLRTTWKAGPLVALAIACMAGAVAPVLMRWARGAGRELLGNRTIGVAAGVGLAVLAALWAWPVARGKDVDKRSAYGSVPAAWRQAMADADRTGPPDQRLLLLPGELFGSYRWGDLVNSVGPALAHRPTVIREVSRYAAPRSSQLQASVDDLIDQDRLVPGQLAQLLSLWGVGQVVVGSDTTTARSGAPSPAVVEDALRGQTRPWIQLEKYGPTARFAPPAGRGLAAVSVPELRRYAVPVPSGGMVQVAADDSPTVIDGDGNGVAELAAHGDLTPGRALFYSGDIDRARLARLLQSGARLVFTDSNRRRVLVGSQLQANAGPTLGSTDPIPQAAPSYNLFPAKGDSARTVATYTGLRYLRTPISPSFAVFPQFRPYAAMDGDPRTAWLAAARNPADRRLDLALSQPHAVRAIRVLPEQDPSGRTTRLGFSVNGGPDRTVAVRPGVWNTVVLNAPRLTTLRVRVLQVSGRALFAFGALGGIDELSIPGVNVSESLRLPTDLASAAAGQDLSRSPIELLLERSTADFPYRAGDNVQNPQGNDPLEMTDAEPGIERTLTLPQGRTFGIDGWASVAPSAPDHLIDRVAGLDPRWTFDSSSRFEGVAGRRASSAFDGSRATSWIADLPLGQHPWLRMSAPRATRIGSFRILPGPSDYPSPSDVTVSTPRFISGQLKVARDGTVRLPHPVTTRSLRIDVDGTRGAFGSSYPAVAISEIAIPGLRAPRVAPSQSFATRCGELAVRSGLRAATAHVTGTVAALNAGDPLRLSGCGPNGALALAAGSSHLSAEPGTIMRPDHLRLRSLPITPALSPPPTTVSGGKGFGDGAPSHVRVAPTGPSWLVLGESYSTGWRAWCRSADGQDHSLGRPVPIDAYANGWRIDSWCREARFAYAPQRAASISYVLSLIAVVILLLAFLPPWIRGRRRAVALVGPAPGAWRTPATDRVRRPSLTLAAAVVAAGFGAGWLLGARAAIAIAAIALVLALVGVSERRLLALAGAGLLAVPVLYLVKAPSNPNNFDFGYARGVIDAHWVAVAAVACLVAACVVRARRLRRARG